ncbi:wax ester/triacylglycerol synthase family O-acyltransferase [Spongiibacter sp. KMU-166]|uniref:diacylglycerol O-acyltransferase n=1 Tax=Spongiibacter thalassae TaxID=2721624 RepID=A0ABX1GHL5_9GAMM|nr:wax ester/triacylglycerol synthase family O-acyltransferase [Spongiibacter thalassae]NKI18709.1 wax ester/triacylglycerol synthase family O-acyltransferase [Spongiibacter thalassae]
MKQLSNMDSLFVYNESAKAPLHISSMFIYDPPVEGEPPVRFKDILRRYEERLPLSPVFRRKLSKVVFDLDTPYWIEDPDFDLEFHVRHIALPAPGDWRQLCISLARLQSRPLDLSRPPWEVYVIEGLNNVNGLPEGSFGMLIKIHHAAIDGATGAQLGAVLHDLEPNPVPRDISDDWQPEEEPSQLRKLGKAYLNFITTPRKATSLVKKVVKSRNNLFGNSTKTPQTEHNLKVRTRFNQPISPHRVFGGLRMDLDDVKRIRRVAGECTLNDVLLSIIGGAMRHYLEDKGELPESSLVSLVPINTRKADASTEGGNEVSVMYVSVGTAVADPLERIRFINSDAVSSKAYAEAVSVELMSSTIDTVPTSLMSLGMRVGVKTGLVSKAALPQTIVTNVPGPQFPLYFCGAKASVGFGIGCITDGSGLFHTVTSYNGSVTLTFLSCREMMTDPDFYHQCINRSLQEHLEAVGVGG